MGCSLSRGGLEAKNVGSEEPKGLVDKYLFLRAYLTRKVRKSPDDKQLAGIAANRLSALETKISLSREAADKLWSKHAEDYHMRVAGREALFEAAIMRCRDCKNSFNGDCMIHDNPRPLICPDFSPRLPV